MRHHHKKLAVLAVLREQKQSLSLLALMRILGADFTERTVRRWLNEFAADDQVEKIGQKRGMRYRVKLALNESFPFSPTANTALHKIQKPLFDRDPVPYHAAWLDEYQPNKTFYLSWEQKAALQAAGRPETTEAAAGTYAQKIYHRLLIDLSYNSSRLEGNSYSLGETEKLIFEEIGATGKLDSEKMMILNHKEAIRYLVENAEKLTVNYNTICTLHFLLSDGLILEKYTGKMRDHAVKIGLSTFMPLEGSARLAKQLNHICEKAEQIHDEHEQSFFLLVHIAYLQAFNDVNKRTSRLAANIPLIKNNLYPIAFNKIKKEDYISAMIAIYELNNVTALAELYTFSYLYTCKEYRAIVEAMGLNESRFRFRKERRLIIRDIITRQLTKKTMRHYIEKQVDLLIPVKYRSEFIDTINQDLINLGPERIAGMGITQEQLSHWMKLNVSKK